MAFTVRLISSLEKVRSAADIKNDVSSVKLLRGERFAFQAVAESDCLEGICVTEEGELSVRLYRVRDAVVDHPRNPDDCDDDYLADSPTLMPDILEPLGDREGRQILHAGVNTFWVELVIGENTQPGGYTLTLVFSCENGTEVRKELGVEILDARLPRQKLLFTQWFHTDSIAVYHGVEIYSQAHWDLIDRYMAMASELGMNMILTPVITPPLDTQPGTCRPNTQLAIIEKRGEAYSFDFSRLGRWIGLCHKNGITHFEISHLYSQWGAGFAPNIFVTENGEEKHLFGWHVKADDPSYIDFLRQFLPALTAYLKEQGVAENCWFHISDEPHGSQLENYRKAYQIVKPLLGDCRMMDALSDFEFYREGLVENPVCASNAMGLFLENGVENLWTYYCCAQGKKVSNRFLAMPSHRHRIMGIQMYKFGIRGFLHWGYNFYFSQLSRYPINPYTTTSADGAFPSGDPFSVYPTNNGPIPSLRAKVFFEALQDIRVCQALEERIGHEAVVRLIDEEAGMEVTFADYPRNSTFIPALMEKMKGLL